MLMKQKPIITISNEGGGESYFSQKTFTLEGSTTKVLSDRQHAENFRFRESPPGYESDWHVAGDPTLIIILSGCLLITLKTGQARQFMSGDMFIAEDFLKINNAFSSEMGHKATVIGDDALTALHLKLAYLSH